LCYSVPTMKPDAEITVVGGGIVGLATADALLQAHPGLSLLLIEKESELASHQTGHNSGVLHSGIYYPPGSLKARLTVEGNRALRTFCDAEKIPYQSCGKVIVATAPEEIPQLQELERRGTANGVPGLERLTPARLRELEPHAAGLAALRVPTTAILDFSRVAAALARRITAAGGQIQTGSEIVRIRLEINGLRLETARESRRTRHLITCGGLQADRLARMNGVPPPARIIPFRGEYFELIPERRPWVRGLIYPVPNPAFPFLGVHLTRMIDGRVKAGPNALLAFAREGYQAGSFCWRDAAALAGFGGFWKMLWRYRGIGRSEWLRAASKSVFLRQARRLMPELRPEDLTPGPGGIRAQTVDSAGRLSDDFLIAEGPAAVHLINAPSPAASACLPLGRLLAERACARFGWGGGKPNKISE